MAEVESKLLSKLATQSFRTYVDRLSTEPPPARHHLLLIDKLQQVADGKIKRLMVWMPPGSAKSYYASIMFPSWYMGRNPDKKVIAASYAAELAEKFGRRVRSVVSQPEWRSIFGTGLSASSQAAGRWALDTDGEYYATGVGGGIAGFRADLAIIDDPIKGREEADSETSRAKIKEWYSADLWPRLKPGAGAVIIQCMVGDTPVLMADGSEKLLREIKIGDGVASYRDGRLVKSKVLNWANQGSDYIYTIRTTSGITVKANKRHPFLVERNGCTEWVRVKDLKIGDRVLRVTGVSGATSNALSMDAKSQLNAKDTARHIITKVDGQAGIGLLQSIPSQEERHTCGTDTASTLASITPSMRRKAGNAPFVNSPLPPTCGHIGAGNFASITTTKPEKPEGCSATTAISRLDTERQKQSCLEPLDTFEIIPDRIADIAESEREDVFDIQVDGTENFIANGLVSHNTRWHEDDLSGWLKEEEAKGGEKWDVLCLPAIAEGNDALGRQPGEPLWPEWFTPEMFAHARRDARNWSALYQQRPAPEDGDYFKREWIRWYDPQTRPKHLRMYGASDYAVTDQGGDYTVHLVAGVDPNDDIYVLELWRDQTDSLVWVEILIELIQVYKPMEWGEESGQIAKGIGPLITKRQSEENAFCFRKQFPSSTDKQQRAQAIRGRMAQGKVYFPKHKPWVDKFVTELLQFPAGKHDDQVDALSLLGRMLAEMVSAEAPKPIKAWQTPTPPTIGQMLKNHKRNKQRERDDD